MGTPRAQHPPPPQLLFLFLLSCPWIQGKDMGAWRWAPRKVPLEGGRGVLYLSFSEHPASSELLGEGRGTADGRSRGGKPGISGLHLEPLTPYIEELGNEWGERRLRG